MAWSEAGAETEDYVEFLELYYIFWYLFSIKCCYTEKMLSMGLIQDNL